MPLRHLLDMYEHMREVISPAVSTPDPSTELNHVHSDSVSITLPNLLVQTPNRHKQHFQKDRKSETLQLLSYQFTGTGGEEVQR